MRNVNTNRSFIARTFTLETDERRPFPNTHQPASRGTCFRLQRLSNDLNVRRVGAEQVDVVRAAMIEEQSKSGAAGEPQVRAHGLTGQHQSLG
jgi:hypothetical protein